MATLAENVAKTKDNFRNIRNAINVVGDAVAYEPLINEPVEEYPARINDVAEMYGQSKYDEGYEHGKADYGGGVDLSKCKYIEKQATGKVIVLNDVSEVYHKVKVYADEPTEVEVCGKNLFDISTDTRFTQQEDGSYVNSVNIGATLIPLELPYGTYTISYDLKCVVSKNARIRIVLKDETEIDMYQPSTDDFIHFEKAITGEIVGWKFGYAAQPLKGELIIKNAQIEVGSIATAYETYTKQTITATPNGTETNSLCPNMTFIADTDITVDYYSSFGMAESQNRFADSCQQNGTRTAYAYAFAYNGWNDYTFEQAVNYDIAPSACNNMFAHSLIKDLAGVMKRKGIVFDFITNAPTQAFNIFIGSQIEHMPEITMPTSSAAYGWYTDCKQLRTIDGMVCNEKTLFQDKTGANKTFQGCSKFTHCIFSGVIANDINLQWSPLLDEESLVSLSVTLASFIDLELNPEGSNIDPGQAWTHTITLSPESWAILDNTPYPDAPMMSCTEFITTVKAWNKA